MELTPLKTGQAAAAPAERKILYWWDPMLSPPYISDKPGKSPMGMDLVPVYEDEVVAGPAVVIDPAIVQNMGVRIATVAEGPLRRTVRAVGYLAEARAQPARRQPARLGLDREALRQRRGHARRRRRRRSSISTAPSCRSRSRS